MKNKLFVFLLVLQIKIFAQSCYSIGTDVGDFTPVYPLSPSSFKTYRLREMPLNFDINNSYIGCYKYKKTATRMYEYLKRYRFKFKNEKIIKHKVTKYTTFVVFPHFSYKIHRYLQGKQRQLLDTLNNCALSEINKKFPTDFYGSGIQIMDINRLSFLPVSNIYSLVEYYKKHNFSPKILILYDGIYSLEYLCKKIHNSHIIEKQNKNTYIIKIPIYISPTASLVMQNKTIKLEALPKPIMVIYSGNLFIRNSRITTWNLKTNSYATREKIKKQDMLLIGKQIPRPYFLGMAQSKTIMVNNSLAGLGFHDSVGTFGISLVKLPSETIHNSALLKKLSWAMPSGIFVGNSIYNCMMGFYTNSAENVVFVGNYVYNNLIYNIKLSDYSKNLLIARNLLSGARYAHGVVMSRGVKDSFIAQNISLDNHSSGVVLDRSCYNNIIYDNFVFYNGVSGISLQESSGNLIDKNTVLYNKGNGIIIRNSLNTEVKKNFVYRNGRNGIEIFTKNIDDAIYRNFAKDPYHKATSSIVANNILKNNLSSQIAVKNNAAISIKNNQFDKSDVRFFGGDLTLFLNQIMNNNNNFKLYGLGNPFKDLSTDLLTIRYPFNEIFTDLYRYNRQSAMAISDIYYQLQHKDKGKYSKLLKEELKQAASDILPAALADYGIYNMHFTETNETKILDNLSYIVESSIMNNRQANNSLLEMIYLFKINKQDIDRAYQIARRRMSNGMLFAIKEKKNICSNCKKKKLYIKSLLKIFEYKLKSNHIDSFYHYLTIENKNYSSLPASIKTVMNKKYYYANTPKINYYKYVEDRHSKMLELKTCNRYLQKSSFYTKESSAIIRQYAKEDLKKFKLQIKYFLSQINRYRSIKNKINFSEIIDIVNRE